MASDDVKSVNLILSDMLNMNMLSSPIENDVSNLLPFITDAGISFIHTVKKNLRESLRHVLPLTESIACNCVGLTDIRFSCSEFLKSYVFEMTIVSSAALV